MHKQPRLHLTAACSPQHSQLCAGASRCVREPPPPEPQPNSWRQQGWLPVAFTRGLCHPRQQFSIKHRSHCSRHKHNAFIHVSCILGVLSAQRKHSQRGESPAHSPRVGVPAKAHRELLPCAQARTALGLRRDRG